MNYDFKTFINFCLLNSTVFIVLISAESLFGLNNSFFEMIKTSQISTASISASLPILFIFCFYMLDENYRELYFKGHISFYDIVQNIRAKHNFREQIRYEEIRNLFSNGQISLEQLIQINNHTRWAFESDPVRDLCINNHLSIQQIDQLDYRARNALKNNNIRELFVNKQLSFDQLIQLDYEAQRALESDPIRDLCINNHLSLEQLNQLDHNAVSVLENNNIRELFVNKQLSFDQLIQMNGLAERRLENNDIKNMFLDIQLSFDQLLQIDFNAMQALENNDIRLMFINGHLNFNQILEIDHYALRALKNNDIRNMFLDGHLDFNQILQCDYEIQTALNDTNTRNQLINNEITWANFYENTRRRAVRDLGTPQIINRAQSTHKTSVHESVSDSAIALSRIYGQDVKNDDITNHIIKLQGEINHFTPNETITPHIYEAAKRGLNRIENLDTGFKDPKSQLSIKQLIALTRIAAKDDDYRQHTYNHYLEVMMLALYEIQRGYNLNDNDIDDMGSNDRTICAGGTFNKIIEKMVGILPDCHIHFITFDTITFRANQLVKNIIAQFFDNRASLDLPNEDELSSLEITQRAIYIEHLKDIINSESNHEDNPVFNALNTKLLQDIQSSLKNEFGSQLVRHFNENFTFEQFIDTILNSETIQTDINTKIERYIERYQTDTNLIQNSLFQSSEQTDAFEDNNELTQSN